MLNTNEADRHGKLTRTLAKKSREKSVNQLDDYGPTVTVDEAAVILGIARSSAYDAVKTGAIQSIRFGRRIVVPKSAIERLLSEGQ